MIDVETLKILASLGAGTVVGLFSIQKAYNIQNKLVDLVAEDITNIDTKLIQTVDALLILSKRIDEIQDKLGDVCDS